MVAIQGGMSYNRGVQVIGFRGDFNSIAVNVLCYNVHRPFCVDSRPVDHLDSDGSTKGVFIMSTHMLRDWQEHVYKTKAQKSFPDDWASIRDRILERDKYTCYRCDKKFSERYLEVHHLIPRAEGGPNEPSNLVCLCNACHDIVEVAECRTRVEILATLDDVDSIVIEDKDIDPDDWHTWVYGGGKRRYRYDVKPQESRRETKSRKR